MNVATLALVGLLLWFPILAASGTGQVRSHALGAVTLPEKSCSSHFLSYKASETQNFLGRLHTASKLGKFQHLAYALQKWSIRFNTHGNPSDAKAVVLRVSF